MLFGSIMEVMMMELMPWSPLTEISRMRREMDDLWSRLFGERMLEPARTAWMPSIEVKETAWCESKCPSSNSPKPKNTDQKRVRRLTSLR
jgi:hypothetical protein